MRRFCTLGGLILLFLAFLFQGNAATGKNTARSHPDFSRQKARHFFMKGAEKEARGEMDQAYEYYKMSHKADTSYPEAAFSFALGRLNRSKTLFDSTDSSDNKENLKFLARIADLYPEDIEYAETYGYFLVQNDSLDKALDVYRRIIGNRPGMSRLYLTQSYLYALNEQIDSAVGAMREYERLEGVTSETTLRKASLHFMKGDTLSAINEFKILYDSNPQDTQTVMDVSMAYSLLGRQDTAYQIVRQAVEKYPDNIPLKFEASIIAMENGDMETFNEYSYEALTSPEIDDYVRMSMADEYVENLPADTLNYAQSDRLMKQLDSMLGDDDEFTMLYIKYGLKRKNYDLSSQVARKSSEADPENVDKLARYMSLAVLADHNLQDAIKAFENLKGEAKKEHPTISLVYIALTERLEEYDKSLAWVDTLLHHKVPGLTVRKDTIGIETLKKYGDVDPVEVADFYALAGEIYSRTNDTDNVARCYEVAISLNPDDKMTANNLAYYLVDKAEVKPGTPMFEKAKELSYSTLQQENVPGLFYDTYAWILYKEGNYKEALTYMELAIEDEENGGAGAEEWSHYGDILFMNDRPEEAVEAWEKGLELNPDFESLKKKVERKVLSEE